MTPNEKAMELVKKFCDADFCVECRTHSYKGLTWDNAKSVALIAVDEIILSAPFEPVDTDWDEAGSSAQYWYPQKLEDSAKWWSEVKQEIEKL